MGLELDPPQWGLQMRPQPQWQPECSLMKALEPKAPWLSELWKNKSCFKLLSLGQFVMLQYKGEIRIKEIIVSCLVSHFDQCVLQCWRWTLEKFPCLAPTTGIIFIYFYLAKSQVLHFEKQNLKQPNALPITEEGLATVQNILKLFFYISRFKMSSVRTKKSTACSLIIEKN